MKKNFTLIELLVVIAIIAILASLIMPALGYAQARGRTTDCLNNKKQIMTVLRMYGNDHASMVPYMISVKGEMRPYSWILAGLGEDQYSTEMVAKKVLFCNTVNKKELKSDGTNAVGMVDVQFGDDDGWYKTNRKEAGRFVAQDADSKAVAYVLEKVKKPSEMILLGDAFELNGDVESSFWTFVTSSDFNSGKPKYNGAKSGASNKSYLATVHVGNTTVAYADGRAEALTGAQLGTSALKVKNYFDENFDEKSL